MEFAFSEYFKKICFIFLLGISPLQVYSMSYSLWDCFGVALDEKLIKLIDLENGSFIEVGANDGIYQSNTKLLEERYGWTGILIEPSPSSFESLIVNRPNSKCFQCALGSFEEEGTFTFGDFDGHVMASIQGNRLKRPAEQKVLMRSLQSILDEVGLKHVNLFSLDTEGYELNILKGIDFNKTQFDYLLIEIYKDQFEGIVAFLAEKGYDMIECFTNYNTASNPRWDGTHNDYLFKRKLSGIVSPAGIPPMNSQ